eukprot:TRINITY_DN47658_c1_g1_i3.p2 TRINITY_DN47658_c1_g1~~TRINITY_DN47658_c1_g1_i3.p2  ORF type:complete len:111 (+),score=30.84 TRINITY_DN47658_c1_g1_i3:539-871(+)
MPESRYQKNLDVQRLGNPETKEALVTNLAKQLENLPAEDNSERAWAIFRIAVDSSTKLTPGCPEWKHQDWFDSISEEITILLHEKKEAFTNWLSDKKSPAKHYCLSLIHI